MVPFFASLFLPSFLNRNGIRISLQEDINKNIALIIHGYVNVAKMLPDFTSGIFFFFLTSRGRSARSRAREAMSPLRSRAVSARRAAPPACGQRVRSMTGSRAVSAL